jgi:cytoskeletal protein CcmA (bactofilin family)
LRKGKMNSEIGNRGELNTIIGKGTVVEGNMRVRSSLRIDGKIVGDVRTTDTVIVGKEGEVEGHVHAKHVLMAGKVKGNVNASGKMFLESTASIFGDIKASQLVVDEGALFNGKCSMKGGSDEASKRIEEEEKTK